jgi:hypothetical protein
VAFNLHKQVTLEHHKDKTPNKFATMYDFEEVEKGKTKVDCHATFGLPYDINTAIGLNITKLVTTLVIPRHCRKYDAFSSGGIILVDSSLIPVVAVQQTFTVPSMADWAKVAGEKRSGVCRWIYSYRRPVYCHWNSNSHGGDY